VVVGFNENAASVMGATGISPMSERGALEFPADASKSDRQKMQEARQSVSLRHDLI